jgi:hypothetical protein
VLLPFLETLPAGSRRSELLRSPSSSRAAVSADHCCARRGVIELTIELATLSVARPCPHPTAGFVNERDSRARRLAGFRCGLPASVSSRARHRCIRPGIQQSTWSGGRARRPAVEQHRRSAERSDGRRRTAVRLLRPLDPRLEQTPHPRAVTRSDSHLWPRQTAESAQQDSSRSPRPGESFATSAIARLRRSGRPRRQRSDRSGTHSTGQSLRRRVLRLANTREAGGLLEIPALTSSRARAPGGDTPPSIAPRDTTPHRAGLTGHQNRQRLTTFGYRRSVHTGSLPGRDRRPVEMHSCG